MTAQPRLKTGNIYAFIAVLVVGSFFISDSMMYIQPGHVGVFINKISGKVDEKPVHAGYTFKLPLLNQIEEYPYYMQTIILTKSSTEGSPTNEEINVNSVEGQPVSCDVSLSYTLNPDKVPFLYTSFRQSIEFIGHGFVKQAIRQAMQEIIGKIAIGEFLGKGKYDAVLKVENLLKERLQIYGFDVRQFTINEIRPPEKVIESISQKNIMEQDALKAQNELAKIKYEADQNIARARGKAKAILAESQAQAKANQILTQSITETLVNYKAIEKWDGNLPSITTGNGGAVPLINVQLPAKAEPVAPAQNNGQ